MKLTPCLFSVLLAAPLAAQGSIAGTVFLRLGSGETMRGAALPVSLLALTPTRVVALHRVCLAQDSALTVDGIVDRLKTKAHQDSVENSLIEDNPRLDMLRANLALKLLVLRFHANVEERATAATIATTNTGVDGAFSFSGLAPGRYFLHTDWHRVADTSVWLVPVTVGGGPTKMDLSNLNERGEADPRFTCAPESQVTREWVSPTALAALQSKYRYVPPPLDTSRTFPRNNIDSSFVGSIVDGLFYAWNCPKVTDIPEDKRRWFSTRAAAQQHGFKPAKVLGCR